MQEILSSFLQKTAVHNKMVIYLSHHLKAGWLSCVPTQEADLYSAGASYDSESYFRFELKLEHCIRISLYPNDIIMQNVKNLALGRAHDDFKTSLTQKPCNNNIDKLNFIPRCH